LSNRILPDRVSSLSFASIFREDMGQRKAPCAFEPHVKKDVFQNANLSREKATEAVCPSLK
jgi:hypothetical protein